MDLNDHLSYGLCHIGVFKVGIILILVLYTAVHLDLAHLGPNHSICMLMLNSLLHCQVSPSITNCINKNKKQNFPEKILYPRGSFSK